MSKILVTGGAGFIGSNFVTSWIKETGRPVLNLDKLAYSGNLANLELIDRDPRHHFIQGDILDREFIRDILHKQQPEAIVHIAAETHVDRSIHNPEPFIKSNIAGTFCLLEEARHYWGELPEPQQNRFRFLHISTDEVFGQLGVDDPPFTEKSRYAPNSPYAASKAAADHLVRAYHRTYGLPIMISNCSNNFGPYQFPEKIIPLMILNALKGEPLPVYGNGLNIRNWLYVNDHSRGLRMILEKGKVGEYYNIGSETELTNIELVKIICEILDELLPESPHRPHESLIAFVPDRPGHDLRYAIDSRKIREELGWEPENHFHDQLRQTIVWYLQHPHWIDTVTEGNYREWIQTNYTKRGVQ